MVILVNNMKKIFLILLFSFLFLNKSYAAEATGQPTEYEVTMKKVELCENATCSGTPFVLGTRSMPADIASASAGADVGSYAPTTGIPVGVTYTHLRVTLDRTFNITADISVGAGTCTTDGGDNAGATQMTVGTADGTAVSEAMYCRLGPQQQFTASIGCQDPFTTFFASFSGAPVLVSTMIFLQ